MNAKTIVQLPVQAARKRGQPTKYKPEYCQQIEEFMVGGFSASAFGGVIGVSIDTISEWRRVHPDFSESVKRGQASRIRFWEGKLAGAAQGGAVAASIFALCNINRDEWRQVQRTEITGANGGSVAVENIDRESVAEESRRRGLRLATRN